MPELSYTGDPPTSIVQDGTKLAEIVDAESVTIQTVHDGFWTINIRGDTSEKSNRQVFDQAQMASEQIDADGVKITFNDEYVIRFEYRL